MSSIKVFNHHISLPFALLAMVEAGICYVSLPLASYIRFYDVDGLAYAQNTIGAIGLRSLLVAAVFVVVMLAMGLYQAQRRENIWNILNRVRRVEFGLVQWLTRAVGTQDQEQRPNTPNPSSTTPRPTTRRVIPRA